MTAAETGLLLLCCQLGDRDCRPLTVPQFRELGLRVRAASGADDPLRELHAKDLLRLGYDEDQAERIMGLLNREQTLGRYLQGAEKLGIDPLTTLSPAYPGRIAKSLGYSCPRVLFYRGDLSLLSRPSVAVVGSRQLRPENEAFARQAGQLAAKEGLVLVSGGAIGADSVAQNACWEAGGSCVVFVADELSRHAARERVLSLSAQGYDLPFSIPRALGRNTLIHTQGDRVLAAQCTHGSGGTWQGCLENFKHSWSPVFVFDDDSEGAAALTARGATPVRDLTSAKDLVSSQISFL